MFYAKAAKLAIMAKRFGYKTNYNPFVKAIIDPITPMNEYISKYQCGKDDPENPLLPVRKIKNPDWVFEDIDY